MKKTAIFYITEAGCRLAQRLKDLAPDAVIIKYSPADVTARWSDHDVLVFIMATGIVVRTIAPLLKDKKTDPAVVVLDETGKHAISLTGGHLGGANDLARKVAGFLGGEAVITTATDVNGLSSLDLWAEKNGLVIEDWDLLAKMGVRLLNNGSLKIYTEIDLPLPAELVKVSEPNHAEVIVTNKRIPSITKDRLYLRPKNLVLGIGCNSGTSEAEIEDAVLQTLEEHSLAFLSVVSIATIEMKGAEPGLRALVEKYRFSLRTFTSDELNKVEGVTKSEAVFQATGAYAVAEPAALLAAGTERLLVGKQKKGNVTVAAAEKKSGIIGPKPGEKGKLYIVGTGPGSQEHMTPAARNAILASDVIVGYGTYLDLINDLLEDKEVVSTGMTKEVDRCKEAIDIARRGKTVAIISGGDPGVYAMAGLVFELLRSEYGKMRRGENEKKERIETVTPSHDRNLSTSLPFVEVIPGISALNASASRLGAPLMHDFACISLSDRLTPWEMIEKRLEAAAAADFVIVLYNPRSKGRAGHLGRAREIVLRYRDPKTAVGIVKAAMRKQETVIVTDLANMQDADVDMQTTVIIGNSKTFTWNDMLITPRGYENKFTI